MYTMNSALARERMHRRESDAYRQRLAAEMRSAARWRSLERRASTLASWAASRQTANASAARSMQLSAAK